MTVLIDNNCLNIDDERVEHLLYEHLSKNIYQLFPTPDDGDAVPQEDRGVRRVFLDQAAGGGGGAGWAGVRGAGSGAFDHLLCARGGFLLFIQTFEC